jgi:arginyl-tRNA synthetase
VITGDLGTALGHVVESAIAASELPLAAAELRASGTWRPVPGQAGAYASSLPFTLASLSSRTPEDVARRLADSLAGLPWIIRATADGGYLTVVVTKDHLVALPARIVAAGPASARSDALAGRSLTAPVMPDLALAPDWAWAWKALHQALVGRLAKAAGANVSLPPAGQAQPERTLAAGSDTVAAMIQRYGTDAVTFALASTAEPAGPGPGPSPARSRSARPLDLSNPYVLVRHAHADAASTLRWAADLAIPQSLQSRSPAASPPLPPQGLRPEELIVITAMSWLPERIAAAARRRRPAELTAYLEQLAGAWLDCAETCPALPIRGDRALADPAGTAARLELADAARTTLSVGLHLLGLEAPPRL